jgi:hypothetical protein
VPVGEPSYEKFYLIGEVVHTYCATDDEHGIEVSLDGNSTWVIDETSYITGLSITNGAMITAPQGQNLTMTVDGARKEIKPGTYSGRIVLAVAE